LRVCQTDVTASNGSFTSLAQREIILPEDYEKEAQEMTVPGLALSMLAGFLGSLLLWLVQNVLSRNYFRRVDAEREYIEAVASFIEKSRLPHLLWRASDSQNADDSQSQLRRAIQLLHLAPIYRDFHESLRNRPAYSLKFRLPEERYPLEVLGSAKSLGEAEERTLCHVTKFLADCGDFKHGEEQPADYLFETSNVPWEFPARYWMLWLMANKRRLRLQPLSRRKR
jgi:hypothetical protein